MQQVLLSAERVRQPRGSMRWMQFCAMLMLRGRELSSMWEIIWSRISGGRSIREDWVEVVIEDAIIQMERAACLGVLRKVDL